MSRKRLAFVSGISFALGYLVSDIFRNYFREISPEKALQHAKEAFEKQAPVTGSWIYTKPERIKLNGLIYRTYRGGISRNIDGETHRYEFFIDIETASVIYAKKQAM